MLFSFRTLSPEPAAHQEERKQYHANDHQMQDAHFAALLTNLTITYKTNSSKRTCILFAILPRFHDSRYDASSCIVADHSYLERDSPAYRLRSQVSNLSTVANEQVCKVSPFFRLKKITAGL